MVIQLTGRINEAGKLEVDLPEGLPSGEVKVMIEVAGEKPEIIDMYGLWQGVDLSADEIDEARREMWQNFPREDI